MTVKEYMDPKRFPLSTQAGLSLKHQMLRDAINYDDYVDAEDQGKKMTDREIAVGKELKEKYDARESVMEDHRAANKDD